MIVRRGLISIYSDSGRDDKLTEQLLEIGRLWARQNEHDPAPVLLVRAEPEFPDDVSAPPRAGEVEVELSVDEEGRVHAPTVVGLSGDEALVEPALDAVLKYRYVPRFVDGVAVAVDGVHATVTFSPLN